VDKAVEVSNSKNKPEDSNLDVGYLYFLINNEQVVFNINALLLLTL